jgi:hypothetical protein
MLPRVSVIFVIVRIFRHGWVYDSITRTPDSIHRIRTERSLELEASSTDDDATIL